MEHVLPARENAVTDILRGLLELLAPHEKVERLPVGLRSKVGRDAADAVLAAEDLEDLDALLTALGTDQDFWDAEADDSQNDKARGDALRAVEATSLNIASLRRTLGVTATRRCEQGWTAWMTVFRQARGLKGFVDGPDATSASCRGSFDITDAAYDFSLGETLRQAFIAALRSAAACFVIARAEERGTKLEPWLALGLANVWASGPEHLASVMTDPVHMLNAVASVLGEIQAAHKTQQTINKWAVTAKASGSGVYAPFAHMDTDVDSGA